jgi:hypothetical protein
LAVSYSSSLSFALIQKKQIIKPLTVRDLLFLDLLRQLALLESKSKELDTLKKLLIFTESSKCMFPPATVLWKKIG